MKFKLIEIYVQSSTQVHKTNLCDMVMLGTELCLLAQVIYPLLRWYLEMEPLGDNLVYMRVIRLGPS